MHVIAELLRRPLTLSRLAVASIVANIGIVVTGGAVRLTGSGLGCPTFPQCADGSLIPTAELGSHGLIEFGNRLLTFVVAFVAAAGVLAAFSQRRRRPNPLPLAILVFAGIPAQALIGGIAVLTDLNPWVVGCHFLVSMGVVAAAYGFWRRAEQGRPDRPPASPGAEPTRAVPAPARQLAILVTVLSALTLVVGVLVTGSGPHAGDENAPRNGLDPGALSQLHADLVFLLVGLSVGLWYALRSAGARGPARAAAVLVVVELAQGLIGFVQYFAGLPALVVGLHMLGATLVWLATVATLAHTRTASADLDPGRPPRAADPMPASPVAAEPVAPEPEVGSVAAGSPAAATGSRWSDGTAHSSR